MKKTSTEEIRPAGRELDGTFLLILAAYCAYAALFIWRTSFLVEGERYFSLFDDAMISMRYARNLAEGHGLVWNPGERVEGYTNLLWTLYMAALHLLPVAASKMSLLVQATSAAVLAVNLVVVRKIAGLLAPGSRLVWLAAVVFTGFYLPLNGWSLQGMEVGLLALVLSLTVWKAAQALEERRFSPVPYVLLTLGLFIRPDMGVPFLVLLGFMLASDRRYRRSHLIWGVGLLVGALAAQTVFRRVYYGELLPNTYYLKVTGYPVFLRMFKGLYVALVFVWRTNVVFFLIALAAFRIGRKRIVDLMLFLFLGQIAYSIYVGGDAWESWGGSNRYVSIAMPLFFLVFSYMVYRLTEWVRERLGPGSNAWLALTRRRTSLTWSFILLGFLSFNAIYGPIAVTEALLLKPTLHVERNPGLVRRALTIREITDPGATIAVVWDGAIPYFARRRTVSILGKNDPVVARKPMRRTTGVEQLVAFYPGHLKWDYAYSIGTLRPDVVVQLWRRQEEAEPFLQAAYVSAEVSGMTMHFLAASTHISWPRVRTLLESQ
jgi:hypothetical protein